MSLDPDPEIAALPSARSRDDSRDSNAAADALDARGRMSRLASDMESGLESTAHTTPPARTTAHTAIVTDEPAFTPYPLSRHFPRHAALPRARELQLWRFRREWLPVPVQEGDTWLSRSERERARLHPNAALRKRFISARVVVRWIVGHLLGCEPRDVDLHDNGGDRLRVRDPRDGHGIAIDIAYGGIWIVIGIAATPLGLGVVVPAPGFALDEPSDESRRRARHDSLRSALRDAPVVIDQLLLSGEAASFALDLAEHGEWHMLDLPMDGQVRAAVALAQPVTNVWMIGWPKRTKQAASPAAYPER
ncbi:hypothetical protein [Paraburkholderia sp.]|uniref:hypothetical protein n=1 Tax=Paraburkholderia sp. TaxID=1926495 RepID=UPI0039E2E974